MVVKIAILVKGRESTVSRTEWKDATLEEIGIAITHLELKKRHCLTYLKKELLT